ncbi:hypothetical protein ACFL1B_05120 [Nanoarchaeota archaeon]
MVNWPGHFNNLSTHLESQELDPLNQKVFDVLMHELQPYYDEALQVHRDLGVDV